MYTIRVATYRNLTDRALGYARVRDDIALLVGLELLYRMQAGLGLLALRLVDAAVGTRGDEAENGVLVADARLAAVAFGAVVPHGVLVWHAAAVLV